jgi:hypothetical protein
MEVTGARSSTKSRAIGTTQTLEFGLKALSFLAHAARADFSSQIRRRAALRSLAVALWCRSCTRSRRAHSEKHPESAFSALAKKSFS